MNNENGVVDHNADKDDKSQHGKNIKGLRGNKPVDQFEPQKPADSRQRQGEHNDQWINEVAEQSSHEQIGDDGRQDKIPLKGLTRLGQFIGHAALPHIGSAQHTLPGHRTDDPGVDDFHGFLQRDGKRRSDLKGNRSLTFKMTDLGDSGGTFQLRQGRNRNDPPTGDSDHGMIQLLRGTNIFFRSFQNQVNFFLAFLLEIPDVPAVHENIQGNAEIPGGHFNRFETIPLRHQLSFRKQQFQRRHRPYLSLRDFFFYGTKHGPGHLYNPI